MMRRMLKPFARFCREEHATLVAEALLILPALVWFYVGSLVYFHGYEARNVNMKAAYTISDMISREDKEINATYIEGLGKVFEYLTAGKGTNGRIRVSQIHCADACGLNDSARELIIDWSYGTDGMVPLNSGDIPIYSKWVPVMAQGDRVLVVETFVDYEPAWTTVGLDVDGFENRVVTRPRFVPLLTWK